ncbi:MAG TPA: hypothetical protein VFV17_01035 [Usitatibacteraceae bacterium]|nr:hypothetical protein [Usitatibacteraceae bacterium]
MTTAAVDIARLHADALSFQGEFDQVKLSSAPADFPWYPWDTLSNFWHLDQLLTGANRNLRNLIGDLPVADVGAADGAASFFLERHGIAADIIDFGPTNMNGLRGARLLKSALHSRCEIFEMDLDAQFRWPRERYGLVFFLGILYHLKNPFYALESMAKVANYSFISTRIARFAPDGSSRLEELPVAYLLHSSECNNDATNYWIFSDTGLKRILDRTGWDVVEYRRIGNTHRSDPASQEGDERAFALLKSRFF